MSPCRREPAHVTQDGGDALFIAGAGSSTLTASATWPPMSVTPWATVRVNQPSLLPIDSASCFTNATISGRAAPMDRSIFSTKSWQLFVKAEYVQKPGSFWLAKRSLTSLRLTVYWSSSVSTSLTSGMFAFTMLTIGPFSRRHTCSPLPSPSAGSQRMKSARWNSLSYPFSFRIALNLPSVSPLATPPITLWIGWRITIADTIFQSPIRASAFFTVDGAELLTLKMPSPTWANFGNRFR